jgi:hypothetical protein
MLDLNQARTLTNVVERSVWIARQGHGMRGGKAMRPPRVRFTKLALAALAGVVVLSTLIGPSLPGARLLEMREDPGESTGG